MTDKHPIPVLMDNCINVICWNPKNAVNGLIYSIAPEIIKVAVMMRNTRLFLYLIVVDSE